LSALVDQMIQASINVYCRNENWDRRT
jgi:hypothetical protein